MSSQRLPGKVLREVHGKPLLGYLIERMERCEEVTQLIVATSDEKDDQPISNFCQQRGIECYRGSLSNVADRFLRAAADHNLESFVRVSGDSPLLDTRILCDCVARFRETDCDLATNVFPRTYPRGQSVEVIRTLSLQRAIDLMSDQDDYEHVTRIYYRLPEEFHIENVRSSFDCSPMQLAVDTPDDLQLCTALLSAMKRPHWEYCLARIADLHEQVLPQVVAR